jgi:hypothetical protein
MCFGSERNTDVKKDVKGDVKKVELTNYLRAWMKVSVLTAYCRANNGHKFMDSGLQMTKEIFKVAIAKEASPPATAVGLQLHV